MDERLSKAIDAQMLGAMGLTATVAEPQEPFTLAKLEQAMDALRRIESKRVMFLSTKQYPGADALKIEASGEDFVVAHPMFWARLEYELARDQSPMQPPNLLGISRPLWGIDIIEIDGPFHDTVAGRARHQYIAGIWERLIEAIKVACVELPEWLKAPPKFCVDRT